MYSLLLMTALATGGDTASFGGRFGGCTGSACYGSTASSCSGCSGYAYGCSGYSSCSGCTGCCGGGLFSGLRAHFAKHSSCHGSCTGSACYGSSCCGGYGYSYGGCCGGYGGCSGCYGTYSTPLPAVVTPMPGAPMIVGSTAPAASAAVYGTWANAPRVSGVGYHGTYYSGENYAAYPNGYGVRTFSPGYTNGGGYGTGVVGPYFYGADFRPYVPVGPIPGTLANPVYTPAAPMPVLVPEFEASKAAPSVNAAARLFVQLPAEAKFYVDGTLTKGEGTSRSYHTPELPLGKTFFYDLKAEVTVEGKLVVETKRVLVRGGEDVTETFPKLFAAAKGSSKEPTALASTK